MPLAGAVAAAAAETPIVAAPAAAGCVADWAAAGSAECASPAVWTKGPVDRHWPARFADAPWAAADCRREADCRPASASPTSAWPAILAHRGSPDRSADRAWVRF